MLLLFFMLTTQFIRMEVLNLSLVGDGGHKKDVVGYKPVVVTLVGLGRFVMDGSEFILLYLKDSISPVLEKNKAAPIILVSKAEAPVQDIVTAMDYIRQSGGTNISIAEDTQSAGK